MNKTIKFLSVYSVLAIAMVTGGAFSATTTGAARPSIASTASRVKVAGGASTMRTPTATVPKTTTTPTPTAPETEAMPDPEPEPERVIVVDNKTSQFDDVLSDIAGIAPDSSASDLAERVRQQRALLDGASNSTLETSGIKMGANACDSGLRKCMAEKCGNDFTKCANDSTAIWGDKMDSCRRTTNCTGHEYSLLAPEILADRDMNVRMSYYNSVLNCGNRYNSCIFNECGKYMDKCLAKSDGDRAVAKCESIARECREQDSGLASRVMSAFGGLRTIATEQVKKDEARLYELRDLMRTQCNRLGAMFDERTLDCVYTVNFFAGDDTETPKASKKLYAGDTFQCNANWFGVDVTTFKENAYRLTRSQTSASAAMLGAGVGTAAGLVSSGAINRAIDTQNAKKAADAAAKQDECVKAGGTWTGKKCISPQDQCVKDGGTYENGECKKQKAQDNDTNNYPLPVPEKKGNTSTENSDENNEPKVDENLNSSNRGRKPYTIGVECMQTNGTIGKWVQSENGPTECSQAADSTTTLKCACKEETNDTHSSIPEPTNLPEPKSLTEAKQRIVTKPCIAGDLEKWHAKQGYYIVNTNSKNAVQCLNNNKETKCTCAATECDDDYVLQTGAWCKKNSQTTKKNDTQQDFKKKVTNPEKKPVSPGGDDTPQPETVTDTQSNNSSAQIDCRTACESKYTIQENKIKTSNTDIKNCNCQSHYGLLCDKLLLGKACEDSSGNTGKITSTHVSGSESSYVCNILVCAPDQKATPEQTSNETNQTKTVKKQSESNTSTNNTKIESNDTNNVVQPVSPKTQNATEKRQDCNKLCNERVKQLTPKNPLVVLYNKDNEKQCVKTCEPLMRDACTKHKTDKNTVKFSSHQTTNDWWFKCDITEQKASTPATTTAATVTTKNEPKASATPNNIPSQTQNNSQCNATYFQQLAASVERDKKINLPNCSEQNLKTLKSMLDRACTRIPIIHILNKDNKSITELLRDPNHDVNNSTFTCATRKFSRKSLNFNKLPADQWDAESDPGADKCSQECAQISQLLTEESKQYNFTNPQCLKQCAKVVKNACNKIGAPYAMYQLYPVTMKFQYWCSQYNN